MNSEEVAKRKQRLYSQLVQQESSALAAESLKSAEFMAACKQPAPQWQQIREVLARDVQEEEKINALDSSLEGGKCYEFLKDSELLASIKTLLAKNKALKSLLFEPFDDGLQDKLEILKGAADSLSNQLSSRNFRTIIMKKATDDAITARMRQRHYEMSLELAVTACKTLIGLYLSVQQESEKKMLWDLIYQINLISYRNLKLSDLHLDSVESDHHIGTLLFLATTRGQHYADGCLISEKEIVELLLQPRRDSAGFIEKEALFLAYCLSQFEDKEVLFEINLNCAALNYVFNQKDCSLKELVPSLITPKDFVRTAWLADYLNSVFYFKVVENDLQIRKESFKRTGKIKCISPD